MPNCRVPAALGICTQVYANSTKCDPSQFFQIPVTKPDFGPIRACPTFLQASTFVVMSCCAQWLPLVRQSWHKGTLIEALLWLRAITSLVVTSINNLFHQSPMTCLCWTWHKLAHCAGCRIGLGGGKYDWSEGAGGLLPALCYYPYGQGGAHSWPRRRHLVTQDPSPCSQEGPSPLHSSEVLANYGQFCRVCM